MAAPTLKACSIPAEKSGTGTTITQASATLTWAVGDVLVAFWIDEGNTTAETGFTISNTGSGLTWTQQQSNIAASNCGASIWTAVASAASSGIVTTGVTFTGSQSSSGYGGVYQFGGSGGVGATGKTVSSTSSVVSITPAGADSSIVWIVGDWNGGALGSYTPTPTTHSASAPGPSATPQDNTNGGTFDSYFANLDDQTGTGAVNYGITSGSGGPYTVMAVEVKASGGGTSHNLTATASPASTTSAVKQLPRSYRASATSSGVLTAVKAHLLTVLATVASLGSLVTHVARRLTALATATSTATESDTVNLHQTGVNVTTTATVTTIRVKIVNALASALSSSKLVNQIRPIIRAPAASTASLVRQVRSKLLASASSAAGALKALGKKALATATSTGFASAIRAHLVTALASVSSLSTAARGLNKLAAAAVTAQAAVIRQIRPTVAAVVTSTAAAVKAASKKIAASVSALATAVAQQGTHTFNQTVQAVASSLVTLTAVKVKIVSVLASVASTATLRRQAGKLAAATATSTIGMVRGIAKRVVDVVSALAQVILPGQNVVPGHVATTVQPLYVVATAIDTLYVVSSSQEATVTEGQIAVITGTFTKKSDGSLVDPAVVEFIFQIQPVSSTPATAVTFTYAGSSSPAVGTVARLSTGVYEAQVDTTGNPGYYTCEWESTGTGQTVSDPPEVFVVNPKAL